MIFPVLTFTRSRRESCSSCLRRGSARHHLMQDLLVVGGYCPLHVNTNTFYACFLRQPLELTRKKDFQLLRCQDGNGNSSGLAGLGLDLQGDSDCCVSGFMRHTLYGVTKVACKDASILVRPSPFLCANGN